MSVRRKERVIKQLEILGEAVVNAQIATMTAIARDDKLNADALSVLNEMEAMTVTLRTTCDGLIKHYQKAIIEETAATPTKKAK